MPRCSPPRSSTRRSTTVEVDAISFTFLDYRLEKQLRALYELEITPEQIQRHFLDGAIIAARRKQKRAERRKERELSERRLEREAAKRGERAERIRERVLRPYAVED